MRAVAFAALSVLLMLIPGGILPAQGGYLLLESVFLPPRFYVGDRVELRLKLQVPADLLVAEAGRFPEEPGVEIHQVEVQDRRKPGSAGEVRVRLFFTPFLPGESLLPSITLGTLLLPETEVVTQSVLKAGEKMLLRGPRQQLNLPGTGLKLATLVLLAVGVPAGLAAALRYSVRTLAGLREARRRRLPYLHVQKDLQRLRARFSPAESRSFFILLSLSLKRYLSERLQTPMMSATTEEVVDRLAGAGLEKELAESIRDLLRKADYLKFSGKRASKGDMQRNVTTTGQIVGQIEERLVHVES